LSQAADSGEKSRSVTLFRILFQHKNLRNSAGIASPAFPAHIYRTVLASTWSAPAVGNGLLEDFHVISFHV
jgi:hypothetical protein